MYDHVLGLAVIAAGAAAGIPWQHVAASFLGWIAVSLLVVLAAVILLGLWGH